MTGRGTGVDDAGLARKTAVVERALARHATAVAAGPLEALAALGGFEIAALAGFIVGGAAAGVPVLIDGLIADAALLAAERLVPGVAARCIAGHRSVEPGRPRCSRFSGSNRSSTSTSASGKGAEPAWPSRWWRRRPGSWPRWPPSTLPA